MRLMEKTVLVSFLCGMALTSLPARAEQPLTYNRVDFEVSAREDVDNDEITVTMAVERDGQKPAELAGEVNRVMQAAVATARKTPQVRVRTGSYSIRPVYTRDRRLDHWNASQSLVINSRDSAAVAALMQQLQQTLQVKSTTFSVSNELKTRIQDRLITEALAAFRKRAELIAKGLGFSRFRLVDVSVATAGSGGPHPIRAMAMMADAKLAPPTLEAGWSEVSVTVSGSVEMLAAP